MGSKGTQAPITFPAISVERKTGQERFHDGATPLPFDLLSFWQWSASDLLSNALRGRLAEFIVAQALGLPQGVRTEWDPYDLRTPEGLRIEVKSAAYFQSWGQRAPSKICFSIAPTRCWDPQTNQLAAETRRQADVYVFCLLKHEDKATVNPMDLSQWEFFVVPTARLDQERCGQKQIALSRLRDLKVTSCAFAELRDRVLKATTGQE